MMFIEDRGFTQELMMWVGMVRVLLGVMGCMGFWDVMKMVM